MTTDSSLFTLHSSLPFTPTAVVLANGDYPSAPLPLRLLEEAPYVACCDGAANEYLRCGHVPDVIVGDGDSLSPENRERYAHLIHRISEQDYNDLTKTVTHLLSLGHRCIAIVGATGRREDHTLGNISLLIEYMRRGAEVCMCTDHGLFIPCRDSVTFPCHPGQQVSIFSFTATNLQAEGLRYPLYDFTNWWQGTLNECLSSAFTIHAQGEYLVYLNGE